MFWQSWYGSLHGSATSEQAGGSVSESTSPLRKLLFASQDCESYPFCTVKMAVSLSMIERDTAIFTPPSFRISQNISSPVLLHHFIPQGDFLGLTTFLGGYEKSPSSPKTR